MPSLSPNDIVGLPGEPLIRSGLDDLAAGRETIGSLLVLIGSPRMKECGITIPTTTADALDADYRLYAVMQGLHGDDAHSQYNALIRQLVSFERALEHRVSRAERMADDRAPVAQAGARVP